VKLISLYIENFGGLSRYALDFEEGLTVVEAANGFGKTTLAEFLRAMFYGFPRKAKTLDKSRRQKYTPWNGGKFGGNLIFEAEGVRYRLERSFGTTPKGDTFQLIDLTTNKKTGRFTEEIGLELFGLDADAFERSTYLPQMAEVGNLTTDSIRSKLSNLLEDTNDVGNFEKAVAALKSKRSSYIPYRGSGGSVMQAQGCISRLQEQLRGVERLLPELSDCEKDICQLEQQNEDLTEECGQIRTAIRRASEAAAIGAVHRQEQDLSRHLEESLEKQRALESRYRGEIPETGITESARLVFSRLEILKSREVTEPEDLEAEAFLEENRSRFEAGLPSREELEACRSRCRDYFATLAEERSKGLSDSEKTQYEVLKPLFDAGKLDNQRLESLTKTNRELEEKKHQRAAAELAEEDDRKLRELEHYFAAGVPEEETLGLKQEELEQIRRLRQERRQLKDSAAQRPRVKASPLPMILFLIAGTALAAAGILLLVQRQFLWGGIALGAGALGLLGAVFAGIRMMRRREMEIEIRAEQQMIQTLTRRIEALEQPLRAFAARYSTDDVMATALYEIRDNREDYLALLEKQRQILEKQRLLDESMAALADVLRRELGEGNFADSILKLHRDRERFLNLQQELQQAGQEAAALHRRAEEMLEEIKAFLGSYGNPEPEDIHSALSELERSSDAYRRAEARVEKWKEEKHQQEQKIAECSRELNGFFERFGLERNQDVSSQLLSIRDDRKAWEETKEETERFSRALEQFRAEHRQQLAQPLPEAPEDLDELRAKEVRLNLDLAACADELLRKKQQHRQLKAQTEQIPLLMDDLQLWQEKKQEDQHRADILDDTMAFLEQARENLSLSYLGPIRRSFGGYMEKLWGQQEGKMLVTQDLQVQLERYGAARELGYFSAGQSDLVMLCMRLALVDALFEAENPVVILDDPFVNLDDEHTEQALKLLKELSEHRQILYLTCSSSRTPN